MIVIYGTHVQNADISRCFLSFSQTLFFWFIIEVKEQKMAQNDQKICSSHSVSQGSSII